jgi:hypothetical protein
MDPRTILQLLSKTILMRSHVPKMVKMTMPAGGAPLDQWTNKGLTGQLFIQHVHLDGQGHVTRRELEKALNGGKPGKFLNPFRGSGRCIALGPSCTGAARIDA